MSNFLAIATVTAALKVRIEEAAVPEVAAAKVRMGRPEAPANSDPVIDLFLYQVTPNAALRNDDLPTRRTDGTLAQRPRAALDLHYLLSFRGDDASFEPQRLLGTTVRTLHASTVLDDVAIAKGIALSGFLAPSDLAQAVESVKITPLPLSLEDLSKLWSVFFQVPYNLSVAYQATVVVIEGRETAQRALPVLDRRLYVVPFQNAFIEEVEPAAGPGLPILAGDTLILRGRRLRRDPTRVVVRGVEVVPSFVSDTEVQVPLAVPPFPPGTLRAGVQGVSVVHPMPMGVPPVEHPGFESNVAAFVLRPQVTAAAAPTSTLVNVTLAPGLGKGQRAVLLLNSVPPALAAHVFPNPPAPADTATVAFTIAGVTPGNYFVRVQVDGAESPWHPTTGPQVAIP
jgi:hypothetical protein